MSVDRIIAQLENNYSEGIKWKEEVQKNLDYIWEEAEIEEDYEREKIIDVASRGGYDRVRFLVEEYGNVEVSS